MCLASTAEAAFKQLRGPTGRCCGTRPASARHPDAVAASGRAPPRSVGIVQNLADGADRHLKVQQRTVWRTERAGTSSVWSTSRQRSAWTRARSSTPSLSCPWCWERECEKGICSTYLRASEIANFSDPDSKVRHRRAGAAPGRSLSPCRVPSAALPGAVVRAGGH